MPKGRLSEKYVQTSALIFLESYYRQKFNSNAVQAWEEVTVRKHNGGGRADGLVAVRLNENFIFTASLEAKSYKTFFQVTPHYFDRKLGIHSSIMGLAGSGTFGYFAWSKDWHWTLQWVVPVILFVILFLAFITISIFTNYYVGALVLDQLKKYPANEQWFALSIDCYNDIPKNEKLDLRNKCRSIGTGILIISNKQKVEVLEHPKVLKPKTEFLCVYTRGDDIRDNLFRLAN